MFWIILATLQCWALSGTVCDLGSGEQKNTLWQELSWPYISLDVQDKLKAGLASESKPGHEPFVTLPRTGLNVEDVRGRLEYKVCDIIIQFNVCKYAHISNSCAHHLDYSTSHIPKVSTFPEHAFYKPCTSCVSKLSPCDALATGKIMSVLLWL